MRVKFQDAPTFTRSCLRNVNAAVSAFTLLPTLFSTLSSLSLKIFQDRISFIEVYCVDVKTYSLIVKTRNNQASPVKTWFDCPYCAPTNLPRVLWYPSADDLDLICHIEDNIYLHIMLKLVHFLQISHPVFLKQTSTTCETETPWFMMTPSNRNIFGVTGPLCGEFTCHRWIPLTKESDAELWYFLWTVPEQMVVQTIETPVIWDAIALIMASL